MTRVVDSISAESALLQALPPELRACLLERARLRPVARGETLCLQGEPAGALKIVVSGWIKLYRVSEEGSEAILDTLGRGASFDEVPALMGGISTSSAEAVVESQVLLLNLADVCACANARTEAMAAVLAAAQGHMNSLVNQVEGLKVKTATRRLGEFLLTLSEQQGGARTVALPFGKVVLAGMLGMKPESLSRAFSRLREVGVRSAMRDVQIDDPAALRDWTARQAA